MSINTKNGVIIMNGKEIMIERGTKKIIHENGYTTTITRNAQGFMKIRKTIDPTQCQHIQRETPLTLPQTSDEPKTQRTSEMPKRTTGCSYFKSNRIIEDNNSTIRGDNNVVNGCDNVIYGNNTTSNGDRCVITGDNCVSNGDQCVITGDNCVSNGTHNRISGDYCVIKGSNNKITGDENTINSTDSSIYGNNNKINTNNCTVYGNNNIVYGMNCNIRGNYNKAHNEHCTFVGDDNTTIKPPIGISEDDDHMIINVVGTKPNTTQTQTVKGRTYTYATSSKGVVKITSTSS